MSLPVHRRAAIALALATPPLPNLARAQAWPSRPIRIIQPFPAGSAPDSISRRLAEHLGGTLGQPVLVENRVGGGGLIGTEAVIRAAPDGQLLGISNNGPFATSPALERNMPYHPLRDATHLAMLAEFPLALAVNASGPFRGAAELLALGRTRPGGPTIGTPGTGGPRLALELIRQRMGVEITTVPFRGGSQAGLEVMAGRLDAAMANFGEFSGNDRLQVVALLSDQRHPAFPDLPTLREVGVDVTFHVWFGLFGPAGLPDAIAARLEGEADTAMRLPETTALTARLGALPYCPMGRAATTARVDREWRGWAEVVRAGNLQPE